MRKVDREPKQGLLPFAIAGGAMLVCCLGSVLVVSGASGLTAWLSGFDPLLAVGVAGAIFVAIVLFRRMRNSASTETQHAPPPASKGDK